jgi:hypothetical protein
VSLRDEWVAGAPAAREIADAVMPGVEHVIEYHMMLKGDGWAATEASRRSAWPAVTSSCFRAVMATHLQRTGHACAARR